MISYEDAVRMILDNTYTVDPENKSLSASSGQVTAEDIYADMSLPRWDISGPDGYAVRSADIKQASRERPIVLQIVETVRAGFLPEKKITPNTASRIMTGSVIPRGADCVIRFEDTDEPKDKNGPNRQNPTHVKVYVPLASGANLREVGSSIQKDSLIVPKGTVIGPAQVSALTAVGRTKIMVFRRPSVAILATGDEIVRAGRNLPPGKCYNSNTTAVASLVRHYGGVPKILGVARDTEENLLGKMLRGINTSDALITTGGVSKGDYDLVRLVLEKIGDVVFSTIKMGPGAAVAFGVAGKAPDTDGLGKVPVFALSGPPPACLINFETLMRPALLKMRGLNALRHPVIEATAVDSVFTEMPMSFVRWTHLGLAKTGYYVELNIAERLGPLASMASANSLTIIPEGKIVKAGDRIRVLPLDWRHHQFQPASWKMGDEAF